MHQPFDVTAFSHYYGGNEYPIPADFIIRDGEPAIRVTTDHDHIYITKAQAMEFFGLVDPVDLRDQGIEGV